MNFNDYFYYDETSPSGLRWKVDIMCGAGLKTLKVSANTAAGTKKKDGYFQVKLAGVIYMAHVVVWHLHNGAPSEGYDVDHKDGDVSHNSIGNLRAVSHCVNRRNSKRNSRNTSGVNGVFFAVNAAGCQSWCASWRTLCGRQKSKSFATKKRGDAEAFRLACEHRAKMIEELNLQGAGYTNTHGVR